jgi:hypothetical protein
MIPIFFLNVEMGGNCILEKYLIKINFSRYIKYLTVLKWSKHYLNKHHSTMIEKLQNGKHNNWVETSI